MIYKQKIGIVLSTPLPSRLLSKCRLDEHGGVRFVLFLYQYRYDSSHLIPSNGPEVFFLFKTKFRFDMSIRMIRSRIVAKISADY